MTITGTNLSRVTAVQFGSTTVTDFISIAPTEIVLESLLGSAGTDNVTVYTTCATSTISEAGHFTYAATFLSVASATLGLGTTTAGTPGSPETYTISGSGLVSDITIEAPAGVQISDDGGTTWRTPLTEVPTDGALVSITIEARINSTPIFAAGNQLTVLGGRTLVFMVFSAG